MRCAFTGSDSSRCSLPIVAGQKLCQHHDTLTKETWKLRIYERVAGHFGRKVSELRDSMTLEKDFRVDSLEVVELVMLLSEDLNLYLSESDEESIKTIGDLCFAFGPISDDDSADLIVLKNNRSIDYILEQEIVLDLLIQFEIEPKLFRDFLNDVVAGRPIQHITTIPMYRGDHELEICHIIVLTKEKLYLLELVKNKISYCTASPKAIDMKVQFILDKKSAIERIDISVVAGEEVGADIPRRRMLNYSFLDDVGVNGARKFLAKLERNLRDYK